MPDTCRAGVCIKMAVLCPCPSSRTIKINTTFHQAVLKIKHAVGSIPRAYGITCIGPEAAIDGTYPCGPYAAQGHLVTGIGNGLFMRYRICSTGNNPWLLLVKAIVIGYGKVL